MKSFGAKSIMAEEVTTLLGGQVGSLVGGEIIAGDGAAITLQDRALSRKLPATPRARSRRGRR
jgi:hypothetical protein